MNSFILFSQDFYVKTGFKISFSDTKTFLKIYIPNFHYFFLIAVLICYLDFIIYPKVQNISVTR